MLEESSTELCVGLDLRFPRKTEVEITPGLLAYATVKMMLPSTEGRVRGLLGIWEVLNRYQKSWVQEKDLSKTQKCRIMITIGSCSSLRSKFKFNECVCSELPNLFFSMFYCYMT